MIQGAKIEVEPLAAGQLRSAKLRRLLRFWEELKGTRPLPARADFGPEQLDYMLGQLSLIEVTHDPLKFRFRLVGTMIEEAGRRGDQNKTLDQIEPDSYRETLEAAYLAAVSHGAPALNLIRIQRQKGMVWYEQVVLPFTVHGDKVAFLLDGVEWPPETKNGFANFETSRTMGSRPMKTART